MASASVWQLHYHRYERFAGEPEKLYQRLPIKTASPLVAPIIELFFDAARKLPIFYTYDGWRTAERTCWVAKDLCPVADKVDLRLMAQPLQTAAWEPINKFGVKEYTLSDYLRRLTSDLRAGQSLSDGPPYLRTSSSSNSCTTCSRMSSRGVKTQKSSRRRSSSITVGYYGAQPSAFRPAMLRWWRAWLNQDCTFGSVIRADFAIPQH